MAHDLRIAFLTNLIPPYHKPLYTLLSRQYKQFRLFISTAMESNRPWLPDWEGLDVILQKTFSLSRWWRHPGGFEEPVAIHFPMDTIWQLKKFDPDVVVSAEMGFRTLLACLYVRRVRACRLLIWSEVTFRTEHGRGASRQILRRFLAGRADGFLTLGAGGARYIQSLGVHPCKIFHIAYSTSLPAFAELPVERYGSAARQLLYSGQLVERKGLRPFLKVLAEWARQHPDRTVLFTLVGSGPEQSPITAMALPPNVKLVFIGTVQYNQLPAIYARSGIFVLPTIADSWAVVVNEALASGVPVLGSVYSQAVEEMVQDGRNGWTFQPDNPGQVYSAIDRALITPEDDLNRMRVEARKSALEVTPEKTATVFQQAVDAARSNI